MFAVFSSDRAKSVKPLSIIAFSGLISVLPVLCFGFPFFSNDGTTHAVWYVNFAEQFWAGEIYPRWLMQMNMGLGSPTFFYYPPVGYYFGVPFYFLSEFDKNGWYQVGLAASLMSIVSGFSAYLWLRTFARRHAAAIAAALYIWVPYHLGVDLYQRGALAELCTFVWMPLILYFTHKVARGRPSSVVGLAISYALLIMSHLPTTLIFSPLPVFYVLWFAKKGNKLNPLLLIFGGMLLGIGLSAIYLLPALLMQDYVQP